MGKRCGENVVGGGNSGGIEVGGADSSLKAATAGLGPGGLGPDEDEFEVLFVWALVDPA